jgi:ATP-dependent exoDNAse (exonuclease V) alpha subunit
VVDEAGMIGTAQMTRILEAVGRKGGKLVLVGDAGQLQPIEYGSPFAALAKKFGYAELTEIGRQRDAKDRQVVRDMATGQADSALKSLDERRLVSISKTRPDAASELVTTWSREFGYEAKKSLIFCSTNEDAADLNRQCQAQQALRRRVDTTRSVEVHECRAYVGDRVLFTKNDRSLGVNNGETGTVTAIHRVFSKMTVQMDSGECVDVFPKKYLHRRGDRRGECGLRLGYAVTTHKGQGSTVDYAYVLAGGAMQDREISYVQLSRARMQTRVFVDQQTAGKDLEGLTRQMDRSRAKDMASDVIREQQEHNRRLRLSG